MPTIQRTMAASLASFAVILTVDNNWFQCNVGFPDWRLQNSLVYFLLALVIGISSSVIYYHTRLGKETVDSVEYQNRCLKIGVAMAAFVGMGCSAYQYRRDILAPVLGWSEEALRD